MSVTALLTYEQSVAATAHGRAVSRAAMGDDYVQAHVVTYPYPDTLPAQPGWEIVLYEPTPADRFAVDWRIL